MADAGYSNGEQLSACEAAQITAFVPPNRAINHQSGGQLFQKERFVFDAERDCFRCPAGETLRSKQVLSKDRLVVYTTPACPGCALKPQCTQAKQRFVSRHFDEAALERAHARCEADPSVMKRRRATVEHPFGTLKERIFGNARFLMRGLSRTRGEMALAVLAYNFKRVGNLLGITAMARAVAA